MDNILLDSAINKAQRVIRLIPVCATILFFSACSLLSNVDSEKPYSYRSKAAPEPPPAENQQSETRENPTSEQVKTAQGEVQVSQVRPKHVTAEDVKKTDRSDLTRALVKDDVTNKTSLKKPAGAPEKTKPSKIGSKSADTALSVSRETTQRKQDPDAESESFTVESTGNPAVGVLVTLESLPLSIGENWVLKREKEHAGQCALFYQEQMMNDGQGKTPVHLVIGNRSILFKTRSNIDLAYQQTGIALDQQAQLPIESIHKDTAIVYEKSYPDIVEAMKSAQQLTLTLGFWPTWPVTQTHNLGFDISDFSLAFDALKLCVNLEKGLH